MKKIKLILIISILNFNLGFTQTKSDINLLLNGIAETEDSKGIIKTEQAEKIIYFGEKALPILANIFTNSTLTKIKSECQERNLTKGEVAIILADKIEMMPYAKLTGIQNCLLTFCKDNPNFIEYYLNSIKKNEIEVFKIKYIEWLTSSERKKWPPYINNQSKIYNKKLYNRNEKPYLKVDFDNIDTLSLWSFKINRKYRIKKNKIQPIGKIEFWRIKPLEDKQRKEIYGKDWTPSFEFEIYKITELEFCKKRSLNTRLISSCYNFGGDLLIIGNFIFLNNQVCDNCKKWDNGIDYCRPLINKILSRIVIDDNNSLKEIENKIREEINKTSR